MLAQSFISMYFTKSCYDIRAGKIMVNGYCTLITASQRLGYGILHPSSPIHAPLLTKINVCINISASWYTQNYIDVTPVTSMTFLCTVRSTKTTGDGVISPCPPFLNSLQPPELLCEFPIHG